MSKRTLEGKTAIVTGSSRGIGRAIAERLARDGADVVVTYAGNRDKAEEVAREIEAAGPRSLVVQADVREVAQVRSLVRQTVEHFGKLDILVNNAAGANIFKPTAEMSEEEYDSMFLVTRGVYFTLQEAAQAMSDGGRIVSISSGATSQARPGGGAYAGSKAAIEMFSNALAKELGARGITVNTIAPGVTDTDGLVLDEAQVDDLVAQTPMGRLGKPNDIADAVSLLVSTDAHWVTMQNVRATGGIL